MALNTLSSYRFQQTDKFTESGAEFLGESHVFHNRPDASKPNIRAEDILYLGEALNERRYWGFAYDAGGGRYTSVRPEMRGKVEPRITDFKNLKMLTLDSLKFDADSCLIQDPFDHSLSQSLNLITTISIDKEIVDERFPLNTVVRFSSLEALRSAIKDCIPENPLAHYEEYGFGERTIRQKHMEDMFEAVRRMKTILTPLPERDVYAPWGSATRYWNPQTGLWEVHSNFDDEGLFRSEGYIIEIYRSPDNPDFSENEAWGWFYNSPSSVSSVLPYKSDSHANKDWTLWLHGRALGRDANNRVVGSGPAGNETEEHTLVRVNVTRDFGIGSIIDLFSNYYGFGYGGSDYKNMLFYYTTRQIDKVPWDDLPYPWFLCHYETIGEEIGSDWFRAMVA